MERRLNPVMTGLDEELRRNVPDQSIEMLPDSLQTRGVTFAFLFGPPRFIQRDEAAKVHAGVCDELRMDDITFEYKPSHPAAAEHSRSKAFEITMRRKEGRGGFLVKLDNPGDGKPVRLLTSWEFPPSLQHVGDQFDMVTKAIFEKLDGDWQKVMAETRQRAQCAVSEKTALEFIRQRVLKLDQETIDALGKPLAFGSVKLEIASSVVVDDPLAGPKREVTIEVLREDPRDLYLELMSQWTQFPDTVPPGAPIDVSRVRPIDRKPSEYVKEAGTFLAEWTLKLGALK